VLDAFVTMMDVFGYLQSESKQRPSIAAFGWASRETIREGSELG